MNACPRSTTTGGTSLTKDSEMRWLAGNWFFLLMGVAFVAMHLFGHGGHGGHGDSRRRIDRAAQRGEPDTGDGRAPGATEAPSIIDKNDSGHQH